MIGLGVGIVTLCGGSGATRGVSRSTSVPMTVCSSLTAMAEAAADVRLGVPLER